VALNKLIGDCDDILRTPAQPERRQYSAHGVTPLPHSSGRRSESHQFAVLSCHRVGPRPSETQLREEDPPRIALFPPWKLAMVLPVPISQLRGEVGRGGGRAAWRGERDFRRVRNRFSEGRRNGVADLPELRRWVPGEAEPIRKRLHPGGFADRKRSVLFRVDVPVTVTSDVSGNRPAQIVPDQTLVFVAKDVGAVSLKSPR